MNNEISKQIAKSVAYVRSRSDIKPKLGLVLGSGLGQLVELVSHPVKIPYSDIPHFAVSSVQGHAGQLVLGTMADLPVVIMQGRLHAYEGHSLEQVVHPIRVMNELGVRAAVLTNAAGGLKLKMKPGDFMLIDDQINLTGVNPLCGPNWDKGPRFVDMTKPYDPLLTKAMKKAFDLAKCKTHRGVYVGVMGPTYETAAEIKYFARIGGGAVGMSTVFETIAARHMGLRVVGVSCITNLGTGLSKKKLDHDDVKKVAGQVETKFAKAIFNFINEYKKLK